MKIGCRVRFSPESGNDARPIHIVACKVRRDGLTFYRLVGIDGLFLAEALEAV
jgi:hypothetical protein